MYKIASKNPIKVLRLLGRLYSLIDLQKTDMDFIEEEIGNIKIKETEEEKKSIKEDCIKNARQIQHFIYKDPQHNLHV
eukprot:5325238-Ditylum_brightwellii.AAC.1